MVPSGAFCLTISDSPQGPYFGNKFGNSTLGFYQSNIWTGHRRDDASNTSQVPRPMIGSGPVLSVGACRVVDSRHGGCAMIGACWKAIGGGVPAG